MSENNPTPFICKVSKIVDKITLVLNRGSNDGIKNGFSFLLYEIGEEIIDPDTNESLGKLEIVKGIGTVSHLQEKMCTIVSAKQKKIKKEYQTGFLMQTQFIDETVTESFANPKVGDFAKYIP